VPREVSAALCYAFESRVHGHEDETRQYRRRMAMVGLLGTRCFRDTVAASGPSYTAFSVLCFSLLSILLLLGMMPAPCCASWGGLQNAPRAYGASGLESN
jgi:hypothetical protein